MPFVVRDVSSVREMSVEAQASTRSRVDAKRQVIADQQWQTVKEEDRQNVELIHLSKQILDLTKAVHDYAAANSNGVAPKTDA
jgi:hypothetical protein